jgi:hypothetical protein
LLRRERKLRRGSDRSPARINVQQLVFRAVDLRCCLTKETNERKPDDPVVNTPCSNPVLRHIARFKAHLNLRIFLIATSVGALVSSSVMD